MPKNPIFPSIIICLFLISGACSTGKFSISVLEPAPYTLPAGIHRVTLLPITGMSKDEIALNKPILDGMYDALKTSPLFQKVVIARDSMLKLLVSDSILNWKDIGRLCRYDTTDVLLILRDAYKKDSIYDYGDRFMDYFMTSQTTWEFYDPLVMQEMLKFIYSDTSEFFHNVHIQNLEPIKIYVCYQSGLKAGLKISPLWKTVKRIYYKGPGSEMREAARKVKMNQWDEAAAIWDRVAKGISLRKISRASHNLALAFERSDVLDQALYWEQYADSLMPSRVTSAYKKELESRIRKRVRLDKQMAWE
jgi:hypothetical protein